MKQIDNPFSLTTGTIGYPVLFVMLMWVVFWIEIRFKVSFTTFGIYPQRLEGLKGIIFSPLIHGSLKHLFNNSIPILLLTLFLFYFYRKESWKVLLFGLLFTGLLTWIIGRPSYHIGASGMVYMLVFFLFFKGILSKYYRLIALSLIVVFLYGGLIWYIFPIEDGVSWEGHLSGSIVGTLFAFIFKGTIRKPKLYAWEQDDYKPDDDPFMRQFDENGNFIELPKEEPPLDEEPPAVPNIRIHYTYKKSDEEGSGGGL